MHFHFPAWLLKSLAAIGVWNLLDKLVEPVVKAIYHHFINRHDESVWVVVRKPKFKELFATQAGVQIYGVKDEIPYPLSEISATVGRKESNVLKSLKRLEKAGKVRDIHGGWQRAR